MALTTFTAAQVLTAAQLNAVQANDYNQTVSTKTASYTLVAADKGTRIVMNVATANTITVNTSLFSAGDTLVIQNIGAGVTTVTAGTATVSSAGPLAIPTNGSGTLYFTSAGVSIFYPSAGPAPTSGLTLISAGSLSTTTTLTNAFSTTYTNYRLYIRDYDNQGAGNPYITLKLGSATANYSFSIQTCSSTAAWNQNTGFTSTSVWYVSIADSAATTDVVIDIMNPFIAKNTSFFAWGTVTNNLSSMAQGKLNDTTSYTDATITNSTTQTAAGNYELFGFANS
jgi:hypothetical protein